MAPLSMVEAQALFQNGATVSISTGGLVKVQGDATIQNGSTFTNNGTFSITGNVVDNMSPIGAGTGLLEFVGTTAQSVDGSAGFHANNVTINNAAGVTLNTSLRADGLVTFTQGIINSSVSTSPLIFSSTATLSGVSDASHVNGYSLREGTGSFTYPSGNATKYQPVTVDLSSNADGLLVRYVAGNAGVGTFEATGASTTKLEAYNNEEYWDISPISTATGKVTITWDETNNPEITTSTNILIYKVAHKVGTGWLNEGSSAATGDYLAGSVTSYDVSSWSPFTLGAIPSSVLPVKLVSFTARLAENQTLLNWQTTSEVDAATFQVESSLDARSFAKIGEVKAVGNSNATVPYRYVDTKLNSTASAIYYRLRMVDLDGTYAYSKIVSIDRNDLGLTANVYPNPAEKGSPVKVEAGAAIGKIQLRNLLGQEIPVPITHVASGRAEMDLKGIAQGMYLIQLQTANGTITKKLVLK